MIRYLVSRVLQAAGVLWAAFTISFVFCSSCRPTRSAWPRSAGQRHSGRRRGDRRTAGPLRLGPACVDAVLERAGQRDPRRLRYVDLDRAVGDRRDLRRAAEHAGPRRSTACGWRWWFGTAIASFATYTRIGWLRNALLSLPPLGVAVPTFWVGLILLQVFSFRLQSFPAFGDQGFEL